jgi:hypothetical protein
LALHMSTAHEDEMKREVVTFPLAELPSRCTLTMHVPGFRVSQKESAAMAYDKQLLEHVSEDRSESVN